MRDSPDSDDEKCRDERDVFDFPKDMKEALRRALDVEIARLEDEEEEEREVLEEKKKKKTESEKEEAAQGVTDSEGEDADHDRGTYDVLIEEHFEEEDYLEEESCPSGSEVDKMVAEEKVMDEAMSRGLVRRPSFMDGLWNEPICRAHIDLTLAQVKPNTELSKVLWYNVSAKPQRMKLRNTGKTVQLSATWEYARRPYLIGGPFQRHYMFHNMHFHWGKTEYEGSQHRVNGNMLPFEMHTIWYKESYKTHKEALLKKDGILIVAYLFKVLPREIVSTPGFEAIAAALKELRPAGSAAYLPEGFPLGHILYPVEEDFFIYIGMVKDKYKDHSVIWVIPRTQLLISKQEINIFRKLLDPKGNLVYDVRDKRDEYPVFERSVYHLSPGPDKVNLLLPSALEKELLAAAQAARKARKIELPEDVAPSRVSLDRGKGRKSRKSQFAGRKSRKSSLGRKSRKSMAAGRKSRKSASAVLKSRKSAKNMASSEE